MAAFICIVLLKEKPETTWPGLIITLIGLPIYYFVQKSGVKGDEQS
jgi:APA family basic amino acid/polyamine antiporter